MNAIRTAVYLGLQPLILTVVISLWLLYPANGLIYLGALVGVQVILGVLEHTIPARPNWIVHAKEKSINIMLVILLFAGAIVATALYSALLIEPMHTIRQDLGLDIWPHEWPLLAQLFMAFLLSELIWYWIHRAEHRWHFIWRLSGHGAHHSFKKLNALNFGLNHPLELFFLAIPAAIIEMVFGVGLAAAGVALLIPVQASMAHANLNLNTKVIGWLFTTNRYHIRHHSIVLEESNTNYGCAAILWDRVFGTFEDGDTLEAGTGPTEPGLWEKFLMPIKEPVDTAIAPK